MFLIFGLVGSIFLFIGIVLLKSNIKLLKDGIVADGEIISAYNAPIFTFKSSKNEAYEVKSSISSSPPFYKLGEKVKVIYLPFNPQKAQIKDFRSFWLFPSIFTFFGVLIISIGVFLYIFSSNEIDRKNRIKILASIHRIDNNKTILRWEEKKSDKAYFFETNRVYSQKYKEDGIKIKVYLKKDNFKDYIVDDY